MKTPNWKNCTEEELWKYVAYYLAVAGIESVLVGGAVVAVYSKGAYKSGDLDFIVGKLELEKVQSVLEKIGFQKIRGRHYEHPECQHMIIEFPPGPLSIGDDYKIRPAAVTVEGKKIKIFSPTDCIRDRLASYIHFNAKECLEQAILVARVQSFDSEKVRSWCVEEGAREVYEKLIAQLKKT